MKVPENDSIPAFEWDPVKAQKNLNKHGVDFAKSAYVFADPLSITIHDTEHSNDENRWITMGKVNGKVLVLVHVYPNDPQDTPIRIISARLATLYEIRYYEEGAQNER
ncbi:MAG: BrnT family toxin [Treponemataceae bacterium]